MFHKSSLWEGNRLTGLIPGDITIEEGSFHKLFMFLLHHRDSGTKSLFTHQKRNNTTPASHQIYDHSQRVLLLERIHGILRDLALFDIDIVSIHLLIINSKFKNDLEGIDRITNQTMENEQQAHKDQQKKIVKK